MIVAEAEWENKDILVTILRAQLSILREVKSSAVKEGHTLQQFAVLRLLSSRGGLPMNTLSEELKVSPPVITGIVDRLEKKGLLKRTTSSVDRRRTDIDLTDDGKKAYRKIQADYRRSLHESLARSLTPEEQETLARLLRRFDGEIRAR